VTDDSGDTFQVAEPLVVEAGAYAVLGSFRDLDVNGGAPVDAEWRWALTLSNSGDTLRLSYGTRVIDGVSWDDGLTFPDPEGASMSLDPLELADNDDGRRWCVGVTPYGDGDLGTPGAPNPPCP